MAGLFPITPSGLRLIQGILFLDSSIDEICSDKILENYGLCQLMQGNSADDYLQLEEAKAYYQQLTGEWTLDTIKSFSKR